MPAEDFTEFKQVGKRPKPRCPENIPGDVSPANAESQVAPLGRFPKGKACETYECEAWKQFSERQRSDKVRPWITWAIWLLLTGVAGAALYYLLSGFFAGLISMLV